MTLYKHLPEQHLVEIWKMHLDAVLSLIHVEAHSIELVRCRQLRYGCLIEPELPEWGDICLARRQGTLGQVGVV